MKLPSAWKSIWGIVRFVVSNPRPRPGISRIAADAAARVEEQAQFERLRSSPDLNSLRDWRETCQVCEFADEADTLIAELLADNRLAAEMLRWMT